MAPKAIVAVYLGLGLALGLGCLTLGCAGSVERGAGPISTDSVGAGPLVRAGSGKCLDVAAAGTADGTAIRQWTCNGTGAQSFSLEDQGSGQVRIVNSASGKCVDVNAAGTSDGTKVQLWTCNGSAAQLFVVEAQATGYSQLRNPHSGKCLDIASASSADGAAAQIYDCNGTSAQGWKFASSTTTASFVHPGVLVDKGQLDFVKAKIAAKQDPWWSAYNQAAASSLGSLSYTPHPRANVECGPVSNPDIGCSDEKNDSAAAYTHALLWYYGGNSAHADKAIQIMNAWSSTITEHTLSNAPLQSAWVASLWPRAGEIIRYTSNEWSASDESAFANMLTKVYLPEVENGSDSNGNWELSMIEATIGIAVFTDDTTRFDSAVAMWKKRVPAYIYLSSDGAEPVQPDVGSAKSASALKGFWYNATRYVDGLAQETCRDLGHVQYGFAAATNAAETARIQGVDLFALESKRLAAGYEFHTRFLNGSTANTTSICGVDLNAVSPDPMWEIAFNALSNRLGVALPQTNALVLKIRPTGSDHHMQWETLTHAETGMAGIE